MFEAAGELDGIVGEIDQHLPEPYLIPQHGCRYRRIGEYRERPSFALSQAVEQPAGLLHRIRRRYWKALNLQPAGLDLGEVENVVNDRQQRVGRFANQSDHLQLRAHQAALLQYFEHANDAVHRRPYFVAHGREKVGLHLCRPLRLSLGLLYCFAATVPFAKVTQDATEQR